MPSSRQLAIELKVSRNTVNEAFDMLNVEGYVVSRQGAPTRVAKGIVLDNLAEVDPPPRKKLLLILQWISGQDNLNSGYSHGTYGSKFQ